MPLNSYQTAYVYMGKKLLCMYIITRTFHVYYWMIIDFVVASILVFETKSLPTLVEFKFWLLLAT